MQNYCITNKKKRKTQQKNKLGISIYALSLHTKENPKTPASLFTYNLIKTSLPSEVIFHWFCRFHDLFSQSGRLCAPSFLGALNQCIIFLFFVTCKLHFIELVGIEKSLHIIRYYVIQSVCRTNLLWSHLSSGIH